MSQATPLRGAGRLRRLLHLVKRLAAGLSGWLGRAGDLRFVPDLDGIDALSADREALWSRLQATSFLSDDEKRAAVGYGPLAIATDAGQKFNPHHDAAGRFTSGPGGGGATPVAGRPRGPVGPPKPPPAAPPSTAPVPVPPGMTLRNQALAGQKHPVTGIPYDKQGFPDFSGVAQKTVRVPHTGNRDVDFAAADRAAGVTSRSNDLTWHHHQDGHTMQLVPREVHRQTGHTGSIGIGNTPGKK